MKSTPTRLPATAGRAGTTIGAIGLAQPPRGGAPRGSRFPLVMALAAAAAVVAGFFPTYFRPVAAGEFHASPLVHLHAALFLGWTALFVVQPTLVQRRHVAAHRALGYAGAALATAMVVVGLAVAVAAFQRGITEGDPDARPFLMITLTDMLLFAVFVGAAVAQRGRPQTHRRLMLLATAALMPAAFGRLVWFGFGIEHPAAMHAGAASFLVAGIVHDLATRRRVHAAYVWGGALLLGVYALRLLFATSAGWAAVADRLIPLL